MRLWDKTIEVRFVGSGLATEGVFKFSRDEGPRISFTGSRSMQADPDKGTVRLWNLPPEVARRFANDALDLRASLKTIQSDLSLSDEARAQQIKRELDRYAVEVYAGYGDDPQLIFRGDPIEVRPKVRDKLDWVTEIDLGDAFVVLEEQYLASQFGVGETPANLLAFAFALVDAQGDYDQMRASVSAVAPNAYSARLANGFAAIGRPADTIKTVADLLGVQWWVRDGKVELVERDSVLPDFALLLDENTSLLSLGDPDDQLYREFAAVLSPTIHPGRGVVFRTVDGVETKARIMSTSIAADSHADAWQISGVANSAPFQFATLLEP